MPKLVSKKNCTACGACINKCPKKCIHFIADESDNIYPVVDEMVCMECKQCEKVCPQLDKKEYLQMPIKAFAGWHNDELVRNTSASGGAATAIYMYALKMGYVCYGVVFDEQWNVNYVKIKNKDDLKKVRNSKYVFSDTKSIFKEIKDELNSENTVIWIGLPCQTAGLKKYLEKDYRNFITIDLICHGVCSAEYLKQYITSIEVKNHQKYSKCFFRDANFDTSKFAYTLYTHTSAKPSYVEYVKDGLYSIGYHKGITYRENCYHCKFASIKRVADITLADYWLIGEKIPFPYEKNNVSLIFVNNKCGEEFVKKVEDADLVTIVERPIEEAVEVQGQLQHPTSKSFEQRLFIKNYKNTRNFVKSIDKATKFRRFCDEKKLNRLFNIVYKIDLKFEKIFYGK